MPCILCLATTVQSSNDDRALGAESWPSGMRGALGVQAAGRQEIKGGLASMGWKQRAALKDMCVRAGIRAGPPRSEGWNRAKGYLLDPSKRGREAAAIYRIFTKCKHYKRLRVDESDEDKVFHQKLVFHQVKGERAAGSGDSVMSESLQPHGP